MANKLVQENKTHKSLKLRIYPTEEQTILTVLEDIAYRVEESWKLKKEGQGELL